MKLSSQARKLLEELDQESSVEELESRGYDQATVNRAALELDENGLAEVREETEISYELTNKGSEVIEKGSPEFRLVEELRRDGEKPPQEIESPQVGLGKARDKNWVEIGAGKARLTEKGSNVDVDMVKEQLETGEFSEDLEERGLVKEKQNVSRKIRLTSRGKSIDLEEVDEDFNVEARTRTPRNGKRHFYKRIMDEARDVWLEMGFREMKGDYVVSSLMNFDALYTPQDHPARGMHDTFFVENPESSDLSEHEELVSKIERTHEDGWRTRSRGWGYDWSEEEAARNVLRTHTTTISAQKLEELNEKDLPAKYFTVGKNFRNETVDRHHLAEFYQTDGIAVGKELSFRNLKGYISEFFEKMGYEEFRLVPSYYPYTEMSVEVQVRDGDEWIGLGGAGMFRPEVTKPLLGFEARVLAWGLGIPRIAMGNAELDDIRELYGNDLKILEKTPAWRRE